MNFNTIDSFNDNYYSSSFFQNFVGRKKELNKLDKYFKRGGRLAIINGAAGTGKSALALKFANDTKGFFKGGIYNTSTFSPETITSLVRKILPKSISKSTLLILDGVGIFTKESLQEIVSVLKLYPLLSIILISQEPTGVIINNQISIVLSGLNADEFAVLVRNRLKSVNPELLYKYYKLVKGNPLLAEVATDSIRKGILKWDQIFKGLKNFKYSGILGVDGKSNDPLMKVPEKIIFDTKRANDEIISLLKKNPKLILSMPPRKFEEIIAEILYRLGYEVKLTAPVWDGGFDIYAAKNESIGKFLYLVECKRYIPPLNVGVQVVRSLYGVVQQKNANAGIIVTTSFFTSNAKELQKELKYQIQLQDYLQIQKWLGII